MQDINPEDMKQPLLTVLLAGMLGSVQAQQTSKDKAKEHAPTQKEMETLMKQAQSALDHMDPEEKKMMDSLGIKMPSFKNVAKATAKQLADAWEAENSIVPGKDPKRIAAIAPTPSGTGALTGLLTIVGSKLRATVRPASGILAEKIYAAAYSKYGASGAGKIAMGLWIMGKNEIALAVLSHACIDEPSNTDNLGNYAAMLSMNKGEQFAIPILYYLRNQFPANSTILNNLGQAWFGLGDMEKAEKYLDSTLHLCSWHPQATLTKAAIEESKGKKEQAVALIRTSIHFAYTRDKEDRLRRLGYTLTGNDLSLPASSKADFLGLDRFIQPDFPRSVATSITQQAVWQKFRQDLDSQLDALDIQLQKATRVAAAAQQTRIQENLEMVRTSQMAGSMQGQLTLLPLHAQKAMLKIAQLSKPDHPLSRQIETNLKELTDFVAGQGMQLQNNYERQIETLDQKETAQTGEGLSNKDFCPDKRDLTDKFLDAYNSTLQSMVNKRLGLLRRQYNELAYLNTFALWEEDYAVYLLNLKKTFLHELRDGGPFPFQSITRYKCIEPSRPSTGTIAEFDDIACQYHTSLDLFIMKANFDCSRLTTSLDAGFVKMGLKQDLNRETFGDQFMNCSIEVNASAGATTRMGPATIGVEAGAGAGIEIDRSGVKDIYIRGGVSAGTGVISAGMEGKISLISGAGSVSGSGIFANL